MDRVGVGQYTKTRLTETIRARLDASRHLIVTRFQQLNPEASGQLRRHLRRAQASCVVTKRTLLLRALGASSFAEAAQWVEGPTALVLTGADPVRVAKVLVEFIKAHDTALELKGGVIEGQSLSAHDVTALAHIPSREQLLAEILGYAEAPMTDVVLTVEGVLQAVVSVVEALSQQRLSAPTPESVAPGVS